MCALAAGTFYRTRTKNPQSFRVKDAEVIFNGALVGVQVGGSDDGRLVKWTDGLSTGIDTIKFMGIAVIHAEDSDKVTGNAAGTIECEVDVSGLILENVPVTGVLTSGIPQTQDLVYASDDNTFTLTATLGKNAIGRIARFLTTGRADVELFSAEAFRASSESLGS